MSCGAGIGRAPVEGFDAEDPYFDSVATAFLDGAAKFFEAFFRIRIARIKRGRADFPEYDCQPQSVDSLPGKAVQIFFRIIVDFIHQFVAVERRTLDRAEETA